MDRYILVILCILCSAYLSSEDLKIATSFKKEEGGFKIAQLYYKELTRYIDGLNVEVIYKPLTRSSVELEAGVIDGDNARSEQVYKNSINAIKVPTHLVAIEYVFYTTNRNLRKKDLLSNEYRVIAVRGNKIIENYLKQHNIDFIPVNSIEQAIKLLQNGRVDFFISDSMIMDFQLAIGRLNSSVFKSDEVLFDFKLYLFIHKKHNKWLEQLDREVRRLNEISFLQQLTDVLKPNLP